MRNNLGNRTYDSYSLSHLNQLLYSASADINEYDTKSTRNTCRWLSCICYFNAIRPIQKPQDYVRNQKCQPCMEDAHVDIVTGIKEVMYHSLKAV
jgi:hypothetical protein